MKENIKLPSTDGKHKLHVVIWRPDGEIKGVLQLVHGMVEHIGRYSDFAEYLTTYGFAVVGHDHLGHGHTALDDNDLGNIAKENGSDIMVNDIHEVTSYIKKTFPNVPNHIFGHSMGSFLLRKYLTFYSNDVKSAIIMGTGFMPLYLASTAKLMSRVIKLFKGDRYRSKLLVKLSFGSYNKGFEEEGSSFNWLTRDKAVLKIHDNDKYSMFMFTVNGYQALFDTLIYLAKWKGFNNVRRDLPVFIMSGSEDPVGDKGKGPKKLYEEYKRRGMQNVEIKLYQDARHEILNELDRMTTYKDIVSFLETRS
ncbi:MAG: alpha/beta fold hydrolase [Dehalococcoidales bacterium]|nr:alpha/beta fold hydrolase [Dehalococcoidales bacterium]